MAIYGMNFNGTHPPIDAPHFALRLDRKLRAVSGNRGCAWRLVGVADSWDDHRAMLQQADNGHRRFYVAHRRGWYAIYVG